MSDTATTRVTDEVFVKTFVEIVKHNNGTTDEVAEALNLKKASVEQRATRLRNDGIALPKVNRKGRSRRNVEALQGFLAEALASAEDAGENEATDGEQSQPSE